jgi:hypothetical protein
VHLEAAAAGAELGHAREQRLEVAAVVLAAAAAGLGDVGDELAGEAGAAGLHQQVAVVAVAGAAGDAVGAARVRRHHADVDVGQAADDRLQHTDEGGEVGGERGLLAGHRAGVVDDEQDVEVAVGRDLDVPLVDLIGDGIDAADVAVGAGGEQGSGQRGERAQRCSGHETSWADAGSRPP